MDTGVASDLVGRFVYYIIDPAILVLFSAGFFMFMWGLVVFLWNLQSGKSDDGKQHMLWGVIGMFIMVSVYGIISLIDNTFQLSATDPNLGRMNYTSEPASLFGNPNE